MGPVLMRCDAIYVQTNLPFVSPFAAIALDPTGMKDLGKAQSLI